MSDEYVMSETSFWGTPERWNDINFSLQRYCKKTNQPAHFDPLVQLRVKNLLIFSNSTRLCRCNTHLQQTGWVHHIQCIPTALIPMFYWCTYNTMLEGTESDCELLLQVWFMCVRVWEPFSQWMSWRRVRSSCRFKSWSTDRLMQGWRWTSVWQLLLALDVQCGRVSWHCCPKTRATKPADAWKARVSNHLEMSAVYIFSLFIYTAVCLIFTQSTFILEIRLTQLAQTHTLPGYVSLFCQTNQMSLCQRMRGG